MRFVGMFVFSSLVSFRFVVAHFVRCSRWWLHDRIYFIYVFILCSQSSPSEFETVTVRRNLFFLFARLPGELSGRSSMLKIPNNTKTIA